MTSPLTQYLQAMRQIKASGAATPETSYYGPLETLLNSVGDTLTPKTYAVLQVSGQGAGLPDGGVFEKSLANPLRSLIEIKPTSDDSWRTATGPQVTKYWNKTSLVLVTNYRDFVVVGQNELTGQSRLEDTFRLAASETEFWTRPIPHLVQEKEAGLLDFLAAFMRRSTFISDPGELAEQLAYYARLARQRILDLPETDLAALREALEGVLGIHFQTAEAERLFFRSSLVQTLFYGLFSAWVLWAETARPEQLFDWRITAHLLNVPALESLFIEFTRPSRLRRLNLTDLLDGAAATLNRVERAALLQKFKAGQAITYFYEPFLAAFDPELRDRLGVWYTPPEIVAYQVARIQRLLQESLNLPDGLADPRVVVLDPCVGTGSYLLEVARTIHQILLDKGEGGQAIIRTQEALQQRVIGFEILTAPFVIAHLQLGYYLASQGVAIGAYERLPIYLTNALTGWTAQPQELQQVIAEIHDRFPGLELELAEADRVKREAPILVILGNPPYNAFAGVGEAEEANLVEPYKQGLNAPVEQGGWGIKKFNLDDLYVRFFRLAERQIAESGRVGQGVVCYISNNSYLEGPSYTVMRQHILKNFHQVWIDNLHGNRLVSERTPSGNTCETIFDMGPGSPGIKVGTAISILARQPAALSETPQVFYRDIWGMPGQSGRAEDKRQELLESLQVADFAGQYALVDPTAATRYALRPAGGSGAYLTWPRLTDLAAAAPGNGLMEKRSSALISIDRDPLEQRMRAYFDPQQSDDAIKALHPGLMSPAARFDPQATRKRLLKESRYRPENLTPYAFKPLDHRWAYIEPIRPLWNEPRPGLLAQAWAGNRFLLSRVKGVKTPEGPPFYLVSHLFDDHLLTTDASAFPFWLRTSALGGNGGSGDAFNPNLSAATRAYLQRLGLNPADSDIPAWIWLHALAVGYAPAYLQEQADGLRADWPRLPMPEDAAVLQTGAALGEQVAALLNPETDVVGVIAGQIRPALVRVGYLAEPYQTEAEREVTVHYSGVGKTVNRPRTPEEQAGLEAEAAALGLAVAELAELLGGSHTLDIIWNTEQAHRPRWQNIPLASWQYVIGGYPVLKKWLSYRHRQDLGRPLSQAELRLFRDLARRVTALILLGPQLDAHYEQCKALAQGW
ncbi:MAG: N-6 DNA methylase [Anaerolineae bacterium]|nr:N-6 DNA methylase [Anaerolineae bacterium]